MSTRLCIELTIVVALLILGLVFTIINAMQTRNDFLSKIALNEVNKLLREYISKELKALEIIKEKGLSFTEIAFIRKGESWETYVETMKELYWGDEGLNDELKTQEEYDLLKEVLK